MGRPRNSTTPARAAEIGERLAVLYPDAHVELDHANAWQLLVATILSAQSTDKTVNTVTPGLFARYPDARALGAAEQGEVEPLVYKTGFFRNKAKAIVGMSRALVEQHGGDVPETMEALVALPGVARKTANVVLGSALGKNEGFVVDTHVMRLAQRLGFTRATEPVEIEQDLMALIARDQWTVYAHRLIWHGRRVCFAKAPNCEGCGIAPLCPSAFRVDAKAIAKPKAAAKPKAKAAAKPKPKAKVAAKPKPKPKPKPAKKKAR